MVAGVSGGLARYFEIHPAVFRVGFVVLTLLGGAGILIYAFASATLPATRADRASATSAQIAADGSSCNRIWTSSSWARVSYNELRVRPAASARSTSPWG